MGRRSGDPQGDRPGMSRKHRPETRLVEAGRKPEWTGGIVNPPVWRASTMLFDDIAAMEAANPPRDGILHYGRNGAPTQWALAEALTGMEPGAAVTKLYSSGAAACAAAILSVVGAGDEILVVDSVYGTTRAFCETTLKRFGVTTRYYDPMAGEGIEAMVGETTRAIFLESPGSNTFEVQDVPAICAVAKARGLPTLIDNTWATPLFFQAIAAGCDLSIVACTKYIGGHADLMLGSVTATEAWAGRLDQTSRMLGHAASPDDAWLALRGLRTLDVRLRRHEENGLKVARWLQEQPQISRVLHPALQDCPGHAYWARDFDGATGLFSVVFDGGDAAAADRFVEGLELFGLGYSWGGYESLALPHVPKRSASSIAWEGPIVRLHVGLEHPDDLIEDLERALAAYG